MSEARSKARGQTSDYFVVYDRVEGDLLGRVRNLTTEGTMLIVDEAIEVSRVFECRMTLPDIIEGRREFYFDIECRWCQMNKEACWHEAGFRFVNSTEQGRKIIDRLVNEWMKLEESSDVNQFGLYG
ncbi:MAG: PilZ domain-containing protein [candidate division Zixibacteria bacterium]|nr:PilZ domain-containing protein [candidate division Zixibacteria bacterium]